LLWLTRAVGNTVQNTNHDTRRGLVEVFFKTNHPALTAAIKTGDGDL